MTWFWYFTLYSTTGFLLEVVYARLTHGRRDRKCTLLLPLCPVYGLGACAILLLPPQIQQIPLLLAAFGALTATVTEYIMSLFYEKVLDVSFWNYEGLPGSIRGRVCLPFSGAWGLLSLALVYWFHPRLAIFVAQIPWPVTILAAFTVAADLLFSGWLLRLTGNRACLQWYRM